MGIPSEEAAYFFFASPLIGVNSKRKEFAHRGAISFLKEIQFQKATSSRKANNYLCELKILVSKKDDGWMTCNFTPFSTLFQSYQDDGQMIMKGCELWNLVYIFKKRGRECLLVQGCLLGLIQYCIAFVQLGSRIMRSELKA